MDKPRSKAKVQALLKSPLLPFLLLYLFFMVCHLFFKLGTGDDPYHAAIIPTRGLWQYSLDAYQTWTARTLIEVPVLVMNWLPGIVWRLADPLMIALLAWAIAQLTGTAKNTRTCWVTCGLMLLYPWQVMDSAGWISTTTNYLWPAAIAALGLIPIARACRGEKIAKAACIAGPLALLYAANMEQVLFFALPVLLAVILWLFSQKRRPHPVVWASLAAAMANLIWILSSPGTKARFAGEASSWFPHFGMRSFLQNAELGASSALNGVLFQRSMPFFFFCLLLCWAVWRNNKAILARLLGLIPLAVCAVLGMYQSYAIRLLPALRSFTEAVGGEGSVTLANAGNPLAYLPMLVLYGCFCVILADLYLAFGHTSTSFAAIVALCAGFASRVAIGFSPTVGVSGPRTSFFFEFTALVLAALLFQTAAEGRTLPLGKPNKAKNWLPLAGFYLLFGFWCAIQIYSIQEMRIATGY